MGVKPFLVAASVQAVLAQRLLRVRLQRTAAAVRTDRGRAAQRRHRSGAHRRGDVLPRRGLPGLQPLGLQAAGSASTSCCRWTTTLREMTFRGEPMVRLREYAWQSGGMSTLLQDGVRKVMQGHTTIPELLRVVAAV
jgi:type IV pilus assembly protein PilB